MKKTAIALILGLFALCISGCQNSVNTIENSEKSATPNIIYDARCITDSFLKGRLAIRAVKTAAAPSGDLSVEVAATNVRTGFFSEMWSGLTGGNPYSVDYKFTWLDENGMAQETTLSTWRTVRLTPGETVYFKSVAPNSRCKDFILNIKESK